MRTGLLRTIRPWLALGILLACPASARAEAKPDWVDGASADHPSSKFLTGVGSGDTREEAAAQARAAIAAVFSSEITAVVSTFESERSSGSGRESAHQTSRSASQQVQALSHAVLEGVEIANAWTDSTTGRQYVLAVLDRSKALRALGDRIATSDQELVASKHRFDSASSHLEKVKTAARLLAGINARRALGAEERILNASGAARPLPPEAAAGPAASRTLSELSVAAAVSGTEGDELATAIVEAVGSLGYHAAVGADHPDLRVECQVKTQPLEGDEERPSLKWVRSTAAVTLSEAETGKVIGRLELSQKTASRDEHEAARRTLVAIARELKPKLAQALTSWIEAP